MPLPPPLPFSAYRQLTAGEQMNRRGCTAPRPFHPDWANAQMTLIADHAMGNPWLQSQLGRDVDVSVERSSDGSSIAFVFTKVSGR